MPKIDGKLTTTKPKYFQKRKIVKKIIVSVGMSLHMFAIAHAMENKADSILFRVSNTIWPQETELMAGIYYEDKPEPVTFSLILGGVDSKTQSPTQDKSLEKGKIKKISLLLYPYYKQVRDYPPTLLGSLNFKPPSSNFNLKEIKFKIEIVDKERQITPDPLYGNLPPKFENNSHEKGEVK